MTHGNPSWDIVKGKWNQFKGKVQERWGELTDDDLDQIRGERSQLVGKIQERYGWSRTRVDEELNAWLNDLDEMDY